MPSPYGDQYAVIIGHGTTGAAGTVRITTPNSLNAATQRTDVYSGTLDLNGQASVRLHPDPPAERQRQPPAESDGAASTGAAIATSAGSQVGGAGDLALSGIVSGNTLTKIGGGTLTLTNANDYTGLTTVSAGTLLVNNTTGSGTGSGAVQVDGGTLGGSGTIAGPVTVNAGGRITGGTLGGVGTLTINSSLSFNGGSSRPI